MTVTGSTRRQFLGALGAGAAVSAGLPAGVAAHGTDGDHVVSMHNDYFDPAGLHVEPGTTVRFEVAAGSHSATAYEDRVPAGADPFDSGVLSEGNFEHTFEVPGTYDYYCVPHRAVGMTGRIVVGEPGGPAEESPLPDGDVPDSETIVERGPSPMDSSAATPAAGRWATGDAEAVGRWGIGGARPAG